MMDKHIVINSQNGIFCEYSAIKKRTITAIFSILYKSQNHYIEHKKPSTKENILRDSIYAKFKNRQN